jgi:hypothetical protein
MLRCLEVDFLSLSASYVVVSSICATPFSNMCSTQADNSSWKLRFHCGCQFPWCALAIRDPSMSVFFPGDTNSRISSLGETEWKRS